MCGTLSFFCPTLGLLCTTPWVWASLLCFISASWWLACSQHDWVEGVRRWGSFRYCTRPPYPFIPCLPQLPFCLELWCVLSFIHSLMSDCTPPSRSCDADSVTPQSKARRRNVWSFPAQPPAMHASVCLWVGPTRRPPLPLPLSAPELASLRCCAACTPPP